MTTVTAMGGMSLPQRQGWEISGFTVGPCLCPPKSLQVFPNISVLSLICSRLINNEQNLLQTRVRKHKRINCWRILPPITTVIRQSVGKTSPLANQCTRVHPKPQFLYSLLSVSLQEALVLFSSPQPSLSCKWDAWTLLCRCQAPLLSRRVEKCV